MLRKLNPKVLFVTVAGALVLGATPVALATTNTNSNDTFSATASIECATCGDRAYAEAGDTIVIGGSVSNITRRQEKTLLTVTLTGPDGVIYSSSSPVSLGPGKAITKASSYIVSSADAPGTYTLTVTIDGVSPVSGSITVGPVAAAA
jgi:hypothetical protein